MSKIKDSLLLQEQIRFQYYGEFMSWVYDNLVSATLTPDEIDKMEADFNKPTSTSNKILSNPSNNVKYNNLNLGA